MTKLAMVKFHHYSIWGVYLAFLQTDGELGLSLW